MATVKKNVTIRLRTSFNNMYVGDESAVEMNDIVQGWLNAGLAEVVDDGTNQARPGGAEPEPVKG